MYKQVNSFIDYRLCLTIMAIGLANFNSGELIVIIPCFAVRIKYKKWIQAVTEK